MKRREKAKEKAKVDSMEPEEHSLVKSKHRIPSDGQKKGVLGGPKETEARQACSKGNEGFRKSGFRTYQPEKGASNDLNPHTSRGKDQKRKGKESSYPQSGLSASETPSEERHGHSWESDDWYSSLTDDSSTSTTEWYGISPFEPCRPSDARCSGSWLCTRSIGSRTAIRRFQKYALFYGITTEFCRCNKSFVSANSETETCWKSGIIHFPTTPPCFTRVDVHETGDVPILFSLSQMKNVRYDY